MISIKIWIVLISSNCYCKKCVETIEENLYVDIQGAFFETRENER